MKKILCISLLLSLFGILSVHNAFCYSTHYDNIIPNPKNLDKEELHPHPGNAIPQDNAKLDLEHKEAPKQDIKKPESDRKETKK